MSVTGESRGHRSAGDPYVLWDAAYVLGALSPAERGEFEEHLAGCAVCRAAVADLAGMPGLLSQVEPEDVARLGSAGEQPAAPEEMPSHVLPEVLDTARRQHGRLSRSLLGLAAALLLLLGGYAVGSGLLAPGPADPERIAFAPLRETQLTAVLTVVPGSNGTRLDVECHYGGTVSLKPGSPYADYSIVVIDRGGRSSHVHSWTVVSNQVMRPSGRTPLRRSEIREVEIRQRPHDRPVLRAHLR